MKVDRRKFLIGSGAVAGAAVAGAVASRSTGDVGATTPATSARPAALEPGDWSSVRAQFELNRSHLNFAAPVLAAHPRSVREAIERHRAGLDEDTKVYLYSNEAMFDEEVLTAASDYLQADGDSIAITESTTMGLGTMYAGLQLETGDEVVTTEHDFYATHIALEAATQRAGASLKRVALYDDPAATSADRVVTAVADAIGPRTVAVAVTWVHSSSGVKLPIEAISEAVGAVGKRLGRKILLCVDGVHGFGAEDASPEALGCDLFVSGCHKWLFGPRGTGFMWGSPEGWSRVRPTIPSFDGRAYGAWLEGRDPDDVPPGALMTPGGFHSFEHRWALAEAFRFHLDLGKTEIATRTHELATQLKEGLTELGVTLITPMSEELSAGIVCFQIESIAPFEVVDLLEQQLGVISTITPYRDAYVRFMTSMINAPDEIEEALIAVRTLI